MNQGDEIKQDIAALQQRAADIFTYLPRALKTEARLQHHCVHPWQVVAQAHPECPRAAAYADLLLAISEKQTELKMEQLKTAGPPDLRLSKVKRWSDE